MEKIRFDVAKQHLATLALLSAIACILLSINQFIGLGLETNVYLEQAYLVIDLIAFPFF